MLLLLLVDPFPLRFLSEAFLSLLVVLFFRLFCKLSGLRVSRVPACGLGMSLETTAFAYPSGQVADRYSTHPCFGEHCHDIGDGLWSR